MQKIVWLTITSTLVFQMHAFAQTANPLNVVLVQNPYTGDRASPEKSGGPAAMATGGIEKMLNEMGVNIQIRPEVKLTAEEEKTYGKWSKFGMSNGHLGKTVAEELR
ncbi:hypothetical protein IH785_16930, partial [candidate division KSB1 bacterium]|nr:hypothetical protein [candidate division KSB1 bacterium]